MAKAQIVAADGARITVDGTPGEIAALLKELSVSPLATRSSSRKAQRKLIGKPSQRTTLPVLLDELLDSDFFAKPKGMSEVQTRLADLGHHYPLTSLSGPLQWHVRRRKLRRFKKEGKYVYTR